MWEGVRAEVGGRVGGGSAWLAGPPAGQKVGKMDSIPVHPLGQGAARRRQRGACFKKKSSLGVISKLQSARAE